MIFRVSFFKFAMFTISASTLSMIALSCNNSNTSKKVEQKKIVRWEAMYVSTDSQMIVILPDDSTMLVRHIDVPERDVIRVDSLFISPSEKDSMLVWCSELLNTQPKDSMPFCTDYVGNFKVYITYSQQLKKNVHFASICDWRKINIYTYKIDQLLQKKYKR